MGDRGQLEITDGENSVFFYTHWNGHALPQILRAGLTTGRTLSDDPSYCLGHVVRCLVGAHGLDTDLGLGFGFAANENDGDDRILVLCTRHGTNPGTVRWEHNSTEWVTVQEFMEGKDPRG